MTDLAVHALSALLIYPAIWVYWVAQSRILKSGRRSANEFLFNVCAYGPLYVGCCVVSFFIYLGYRGAKNIHLIVGPHSRYNLPESVEGLVIVYVFAWACGVVYLAFKGYQRAENGIIERRNIESQKESAATPSDDIEMDELNELLDTLDKTTSKGPTPTRK